MIAHYCTDEGEERGVRITGCSKAAFRVGQRWVVFPGSPRQEAATEDASQVTCPSCLEHLASATEKALASCTRCGDVGRITHPWGYDVPCPECSAHFRSTP